jgi:hypothetical protein
MRTDRRGWTTATDHGRLEPVQCCGYLLKVARLDARPLPTAGHSIEFSAFDEELYTFDRADDD